MAVPTLRSSPSSAGDSGNTTLTLSVPTGLADGDVVFLTLDFQGDPGTVSWPSGFTDVSVPAASTSPIHKAFAWKHVTNASGESDYAPTWDNSVRVVGTASASPDCDTTDPVDVKGFTETSGFDDSWELDGVTTTVDDTLLFLWYALRGNKSVTGPGTDFVDLFQGGAGLDVKVSIETSSQATAGSTGSLDATLSGSDTEGYNGVIAIQPPQAGGVSQTIGQATETDAAQAVSALKEASIGQAVETDTAQAVAAVLSQTIGQATETDLAQSLDWMKELAVGQAVEVDTAQSVTAPGEISQEIGQAVEADTAQAVTWTKVLAIGQAVEADTGQPVTWVKVLGIGQAVETDLAQPVVSSGGAPVVLEIEALAYYQFQRAGGHLVAAPVGRSASSGFRTSEGFERVSDVIRMDQAHDSDASVEKAMEAVASAWAANSGASVATLKSAIHTALQAAGFRGQGGVDLI